MKTKSKNIRKALNKICKRFGKALDASVGGVRLSDVRDREKEEIVQEYKRAKAEYLSLSEEERSAWLEENGYNAEDFEDGVLEEDEGEKGDAKAGERYSFENTQNGLANDGLLMYDDEMHSIIESRGDRVIYDAQSLRKFVDDAFDNKTVKLTGYFGRVPSEALSKIENKIHNLPSELRGNLFKKGRDYSIAATLDSIRHIVDEKDLTRSDVFDYLDKMADTILDSDSATFDYYRIGDNNYANGILFKKTFEDGAYRSFELVSHKKRSLALQTLFLNWFHIKKEVWLSKRFIWRKQTIKKRRLPKL